MKYHKGRVYEYTAFFEANEHGGYKETGPALPGLVTEGRSLEHARRMGGDWRRRYMEGLKIHRDTLYRRAVRGENHTLV